MDDSQAMNTRGGYAGASNLVRQDGAVSKRPPTVQDGLDALDRLVTEAHGSLSALEDRLMPVLGAQPPGTGNAAGIRENSPILLERIQQIAGGLAALVERQQRLGNRLQI